MGYFQRERPLYMLRKALCLFFLFIVCTGCSRLLLLKRIASSQKQMETYIARQKKGFLRLKQDIQRNRLQKGISRETVIKRYAEPVFCNAQESPLDIGISQSCLYRAPTEYFSADKVYLYFNRQESLHSWKYDPAE
jgi:hypothetical protein